MDRVSAQSFSAKLPNNIRQIRQAIAEGRYAFSPLRVAPIPKASGGERIIAVPTVRDRFVQRAILSHLEQDERFPRPSSISYGFAKGRKLSDAHARALELRIRHPWVVQADIVKFFDNINRGLVRKSVQRSVRSKIVRELIDLAVGCELDTDDPKARSLAAQNQIRVGKGLRQGMPLSPVLSNLLLRRFDEVLTSGGLRVVRYADDLAIFCDSEAECHRALDFCRHELLRLKLDIPELADQSKTKILNRTEPVEFLGVDIKWHEGTYRIFAPFRRLARIEENLKKLCTVEYCTENKITFPRMLRTIEASTMGHVRAVAALQDADVFVQRLQGLRRQYEETLLITLIGKNAVKNLTAEKRAVLGLEGFS